MKIRYTLLYLLLTSTISLQAQKITLGTYKMKDGGEYKGEMQAGKPHGKGRTVWKDGDVFEGEYVKGKRQFYCFLSEGTGGTGR